MRVTWAGSGSGMPPRTIAPPASARRGEARSPGGAVGGGGRQEGREGGRAAGRDDREPETEECGVEEDPGGEAERAQPLGGEDQPVDRDREGEARQQRDEHAREAVVLPRQARREGARPQERVTDRAPEPLPLGLVRLFHPSSA